MNKWQLEYSSAAMKDMRKLDGSQQKLVIKALDKVVQNPVAESEVYKEAHKRLKDSSDHESR